MSHPSPTQSIKISLAFLIAVVAVAFVFPVATADSPNEPKRVAFEAIDRNADQIATVGDVLYYFAEPGMQEYESAKFVKETLESAGFNVEAWRSGHANQCLGQVGIRKTGDCHRH